MDLLLEKYIYVHTFPHFVYHFRPLLAWKRKGAMSRGMQAASLEAGKGKKTCYRLEPPERTPFFILAQGDNMLDF